MTREEEIKYVSELVYPYTNGVFTDGMRECFIKGAEWADQNPRKGLWDAEKVKQFLRDNTMFGNHPAVFEEFIKSLTQYMED